MSTQTIPLLVSKLQAHGHANSIASFGDEAAKALSEAVNIYHTNSLRIDARIAVSLTGYEEDYTCGQTCYLFEIFDYGEDHPPLFTSNHALCQDNAKEIVRFVIKNGDVARDIFTLFANQLSYS